MGAGGLFYSRRQLQFPSDRQVILFLVSDSLVKDTGQYLAEQSGDHKNKDDHKNRRGHIDKQTTAGDECDQEAVGSHVAQGYDILMDKAVFVQDTPEHFAKLSDDQDSQNAREYKDDGQRPYILGEVGIVSSIETDDKGYQNGGQDSGKEHEVQESFGKHS